jgi:hypothetical protein
VKDFKGPPPSAERTRERAPALAGWLEDEFCPKIMGILSMNLNICMERQVTSNGQPRPACVGMEEAKQIQEMNKKQRGKEPEVSLAQ